MLKRKVSIYLSLLYSIIYFFIHFKLLLQEIFCWIDLRAYKNVMSLNPQFLKDSERDLKLNDLPKSHIKMYNVFIYCFTLNLMKYKTKWHQYVFKLFKDTRWKIKTDCSYALNGNICFLIFFLYSYINFDWILYDDNTNVSLSKSNCWQSKISYRSKISIFIFIKFL